MASTADFKNGLCLEMNNDIYTIVEFQHVKPGKGAAFVRTKMKSLRTGKTLEKTFNAGEKVTTARVEKRAHQFLYKDDLGYNFMDTDNFEQISLQERLIERSNLLKDGQLVDILVHAEHEIPLSVELPPFVELMITYTEPGIQGDRSSGGTKPATVETGIEIQVPLFIKQDEVVMVDTRDGSYQGRAS